MFRFVLPIVHTQPIARDDSAVVESQVSRTGLPFVTATTTTAPHSQERFLADMPVTTDFFKAMSRKPYPDVQEKSIHHDGALIQRSL